MNKELVADLETLEEKDELVYLFQSLIEQYHTANVNDLSDRLINDALSGKEVPLSPLNQVFNDLVGLFVPQINDARGDNNEHHLKSQLQSAAAGKLSLADLLHEANAYGGDSYTATNLLIDVGLSRTCHNRNRGPWVPAFKYVLARTLEQGLKKILDQIFDGCSDKVLIELAKADFLHQYLYGDYVTVQGLEALKAPPHFLFTRDDLEYMESKVSEKTMKMARQVFPQGRHD